MLTKFNIVLLATLLIALNLGLLSSEGFILSVSLFNTLNAHNKHFIIFYFPQGLVGSSERVEFCFLTEDFGLS